MLITALILLLAGIAALGVGLFSPSPAWTLASIVVTAAAGLVLLVGRRSLRRPSPPPSARAGRDAAAIHAAGVFAPPAPADATDAETTPIAGEDPAPAPPPDGADPDVVDASAGPRPEPVLAPDDRLFAVADGDFPIVGYEELRVAELLPLLGHLDPAGLQTVKEREVADKARATVLARIDELMAVTDDGFPITGYEAMRVVDVLPLLRTLDQTQLEAVADRERRGAARQTILGRIDDMLGGRGRSRPAADEPDLFGPAEAPAGSIAP